jgi:hypothetical protein
VVTGLLYVEDDAADMHALDQTIKGPSPLKLSR